MRKIGFLMVLVLAACSAQRPPGIDSAIFCTDGADCTEKWDKAIKWVNDTSAYDIASQSDTVIQTKGPDPHSPVSALTVTRKEIGHGLSRIDLISKCDTDFFNCSPSPETYRAGFIHAVDPQHDQAWQAGVNDFKSGLDNTSTVR